MKVTTYAVDLAKKVFQVHGFDAHGQRVAVKRLRRAGLVRFFHLEAAPCEVVMEACGSAHHWGRELEALGYRVGLIPPQHVKALVVGDKTDANDCDAIYEASRRPKVRWVPVKTVAQQEMLALHGVRARLIKARTALTNQARGFLAEVGQVAPRGAAALRRLIAEHLEEAASALTPGLRQLLAELQEEWDELEGRLVRVERLIRAQHQASEVTRRLAEVPGVGVLTATAVQAKLGAGRQFQRARQASAWVGLVPREESSGERRWLGRITKRGDKYLRALLVHGARSAVLAAHRKDDAHSRWIRGVVARRGHNRAVVAVANKNMRILWAMLAQGTAYRPATA
jgi:transposase